MLTLNDGRAELWQWDTGRTLAVDADCSQVHFSNKVFGRSIDVDVADGVAIIPDVLLQTDRDLSVWAFVGTAENGYTKISKTFKVNRRNKPADYVFTPTDQTSLEEIKGKIEYLESIQDPDAIKNAVEEYLGQNPVEAPVQSVNGKIGAVQLSAKDVGALAQDDLQAGVDAALAQAKASGEFDGAPGDPGTDGITPTIGDNGNWYLGDIDTGKPSRGADGKAEAEPLPLLADVTFTCDAVKPDVALSKTAKRLLIIDAYNASEDAQMAENYPKLNNRLVDMYISAIKAKGHQIIVVDLLAGGYTKWAWAESKTGPWDGSTALAYGKGVLIKIDWLSNGVTSVGRYGTFVAGSTIKAWGE